jgi:hypothetical protein
MDRKQIKKIMSPKKEYKPKVEKMFIREIDPAMMKRLKEHSKLHSGGMSSKHMKNMIKYLKENAKATFSQAHNHAKKLDKPKAKSKKPIVRRSSY